MSTETTTPVLGYIQVYAPEGKPLVDHMGLPWETAELAQADLTVNRPDDPELWRVVAVVEVDALKDAAEGRHLAEVLVQALKSVRRADAGEALNTLMAWVNAGDEVAR